MDPLKKKILILLFGLLAEAILESTLIPLFPFIVRHLKPDEDESLVGYYSGLLGSSFYLPLFIMNLVWGAASDKYGRKPILVIGLIATGLTTVGLGLSQSYKVTLLFRFLAGVFGANSTVSKGFIGDIARDQRTRAWGYSIYGAIYGLSGILGPLIGGLLANPADLYPNTFSKAGFFGKYPFMLVSIFVVIMNFFGFISIYYYLNEDSKKDYEELIDIDGIAERKNEINLNDDILNRRKLEKGEDIDSIDMLSQERDSEYVLWSWNTMGPIFLYVTIAYTNTTYMTALPLYFSSPVESGGLALNSKDTSFSFTALSGTKLLVQLFMFDKVLLRIGDARRTFRTAMVIYLPYHAIIPFISSVGVQAQLILIIMVMLAFGTCESLGYLSVILMITESQNPKKLGIAHGFAATFSALARTFAPTVSGALWTWGVTVGWPWIVFFVAGSVSLMGAIASSGP
jgi:MFS family permease